MDAQLQQIIELQTKQNQLLERYLWRFRFSLLTSLVLTTGICICLGVMIYSKPTATSPLAAPAGYWPTPVIMPTNNAQMQPVYPAPANAVPTFTPPDPAPGK